jgi:hypothetical protein
MSAFIIFPLFPRLPHELQREVWKLAAEGAEPRIITLPRKKGRILGALHACHLSRSIAKKNYKPWTYREHQKGNKWTFRINIKVDFVFLSDDTPFRVTCIHMAPLLNSIQRLAISRLSHLSLSYQSKGLEFTRTWLERFRAWFPRVEELIFIINASSRQHGEYGDLIKSDDLPSINFLRNLGTEIEQCQNGANFVPLKFNVMEFRKE